MFAPRLPSNDLRLDHLDDELMLFGEPPKISHLNERSAACFGA